MTLEFDRLEKDLFLSAKAVTQSMKKKPDSTSFLRSAVVKGGEWAVSGGQRGLGSTTCVEQK